MSSLTDAWPVAAGVLTGPGVFFGLYRWVVKALLAQITMLTAQRDASTARESAIQAEMDTLQNKYDGEQTKRRELQDKVEFVLPRITLERDALIAENIRLKAGTP